MIAGTIRGFLGPIVRKGMYNIAKVSLVFSLMFSFPKFLLNALVQIVSILKGEV